MEELGFAVGVAIILAFAVAGMTFANYYILRRSERNLAMVRSLRDETIRAALTASHQRE